MAPIKILAFIFNCHSLGNGFIFSEIRCQLAVLCKLHVISAVGISMEAEKKYRDNRPAGISRRVRKIYEYCKTLSYVTPCRFVNSCL